MRDILRMTQLFSELDERSLEEIAAACRLRRTDANEMLFYEEDPAGAFYIVASGKVKVFKMSAEGKEQILMIAQAGDSFGEAAVFAGRNYPASAQTLSASEILIVERNMFISLLEKKPELAMNLIARLSELLRKLTRLVEELSLTDVTTRLAHYLVEEIDPESPDPHPVVTLSEKKSIVASQLGTIPETLSRSLAKLSREKIIRVDGSKIEILNYDRLRELAGSG